MFEHGFEHLKGYEVWPPRGDGDRGFHTLRSHPDWKSSGRRLLVLPHPMARQFGDALERLGANVESDAEKRREGLLDDLSSRLRKIVVPTKISKPPKSEYRRFSSRGRPSIYLQLQKDRIIFKTTVKRVGAVRRVETWVKKKHPLFQWCKPEKNNNICIGIPNSVSDGDLDALFTYLASVL